jgi:hypothetical protein
MLATLTTPDLTLLFLGLVEGLGSAVLLMLWQIENHPQRKRRGH